MPQAEKELMENGLLKTDMFESVLEGTDREFCLQHPIFGFFSFFFFFVNKKKLFFSIHLCLLFLVSVLAKDLVL